eukprot:Tamp_20051.p1 GENE.Tamp_20051~~Tamp_20051.p1  ORF type:complete len:397 (+),score=54.86 Tamp_20051:1-1191(+)
MLVLMAACLVPTVQAFAGACLPALGACRQWRAHGLLQLAETRVPGPVAREVASHADRLRERGFTVLADPIMDTALVERARALTQSRLSQLLVDVEAAGCSPYDQQYLFHEIVHRQRNRWDLQLAAPQPPKYRSSKDVTECMHLSPIDEQHGDVWAQFCRAVLAVATPIIHEAQKDDRSAQGNRIGERNNVIGERNNVIEPVVVGAVISRPGARVQRFHCDAAQEHFAKAEADASQRIYNLFIPLVQQQENGDGTQFWGARRPYQLNHSLRDLAEHFLALETGAFESPLREADIHAPACAAGGLIIFDYRTLHRGLENPVVGGRDRAVAYVTVATGGAQESYQFSDTRLSDVICGPQGTVSDVASQSSKIVAEFPYFAELNGCRAQDSLDYYTEISG